MGVRKISLCILPVYSQEIEYLYVGLVREFEACMLGYFSFHWDHSSAIIDQRNEDSEDKECFFNFNGTAEGHW